jgi:hypothetical protein
MVSRLKEKIRGKPVLIFGAGPSLEKSLKEIIALGLHDYFVVIAADGATTALLEHNIIPDVVVTDLDGRVEDLLKADRLGAIMVVHAHSDNVKALREYVPRLTKVVGTTQVEELPNIYNFGGFTDGDRAAFLAEEMGARAIVLAGMDLGQIVGKYSKPGLTENVKASEVKAKKLQIARELLEWLASWAKAKIVNVAGGERIRGIRSLSAKELTKWLAEINR